MALRPVEARLDTESWVGARDVLVVRPDGLGDLLMSVPAIRALATAGPADRRITLLTSAAAAPAVPLIPEVDRAIAAPLSWVGSGATADVEGELELLEEIRSCRFDAAAILTVNTQSALPAALFCRLAGIPLRLAHSRENPYGLLTQWVPDPEPGVAFRHEVRRQLDLVASVGARPATSSWLKVPASARAEARQALHAAGIDPCARWLAIHPGASAASRRYPPASFARAADLLIADGWQVVVASSSSDVESVEEMLERMERRPALLSPDLPLPVLAAVFLLAQVVVANNSGPGHLAAGVGTPVVSLYALTNPQHAPWGVPHRTLNRDVDCRNCLRSVCPEGHHACLAEVRPERVRDAARELGAMGPVLSATPRDPFDAADEVARLRGRLAPKEVRDGHGARYQRRLP